MRKDGAFEDGRVVGASSFCLPPGWVWVAILLLLFYSTYRVSRAQKNNPGSVPRPPAPPPGLFNKYRSRRFVSLIPSSSHLVVARADKRLGVVAGETILLQADETRPPHGGVAGLFHQVALKSDEHGGTAGRQTGQPTTNNRRKKKT